MGTRRSTPAMQRQNWRVRKGGSIALGPEGGIGAPLSSAAIFCSINFLFVTEKKRHVWVEPPRLLSYLASPRLRRVAAGVAQVRPPTEVVVLLTVSVGVRPRATVRTWGPNGIGRIRSSEISEHRTLPPPTNKKNQATSRDDQGGKNTQKSQAEYRNLRAPFCWAVL